ncbi:MAG: sodium:solute symporter [Muribaculaceae bacterium]|nr:sodium:solute symporter [Muribaculaceae bacterium]
MENHWIVIITIIAYFALLLLISYFASRKSDNATFFSGNRKNPWILVSIATIGAAISGVTFISVPGMVETKGYSYLQMCLGFIVGYFLIAFVLVPMFYKRNLVSIYGYLGERFGVATYRSGAWFFFVSKMLGASVRFLVVCSTLQILVFDPLNIPFVLNVVATIALIWLYTAQGGVKSVIWTDVLKSCCLVLSVVLCIYFIAQGMGFSIGEMVSAVAGDSTSQIFFFDDPKEGTYFWKQFLAGVFMVIATTGLDQDMMQRNLACKDSKESQKNMIVSSIVQFFVIALFLVLGTLLVMYMNKTGIAMPEKSDDIFGLVAQSAGMPVIVLILFVLGLISAAYSAAGSALTSLTTSFTVDILDGQKKYNDAKLTRVRKMVHITMSVLMGLVIIVFYYASNQDAISAVYTLASYTYGPILGLFVFGMFIKLQVHDKWVPVVCVLAPALSWVVQWQLKEQFNYTTSFELLIINAVLTIIGLAMLSKGKIEE